MRQIVLSFGLLALAFLILFRLSQYAYFRSHFSLEMLIALFCLIFFGLGVLFTRKRASQAKTPKPLANFAGKQSTPANEGNLKKLGLSRREYEILLLISEGLSNQEIARRLFLTESTVKTHVSNLLLKLEARRRTHAVKIARELEILPKAWH